MMSKFGLSRVRLGLSMLSLRRSCSKTDGPDFICVGMVKAATHWLYHQLRYHPDFWMPPVKELRYLNKPLPTMANVLDRLHRLENRAESLRRPPDDPKLMFLKEAGALAGTPMDVEKYARLFRFKGKLLSGDVSPGYY